MRVVQRHCRVDTSSHGALTDQADECACASVCEHAVLNSCLGSTARWLRKAVGRRAGMAIRRS
eukprot:10335632-Alexandrium_andersonii.AAC.1